MPRPVVDAMHAHVALEAQLGGYEAAAARADAIDDFYAAAAELIGCEPGEHRVRRERHRRVTPGRSPRSPFERRRCVLTTRDDFISNQIAFLSLRKRFGIEVVHAPTLAGRAASTSTRLPR